MTKTEIWGFVPARGGSKSIPLKNLVTFGGIPLLDYGVIAAKHSASITRIIGSTDDEKIARRMSQLAIECDRRPKSLAGDDIPVADVARDFLNRQREAGKTLPSLLVLIQPTSPFLLPEQIDRLVRLLLSDSLNQSGQTITHCPHNYHEWNQRWFEENLTGFVHPSQRQSGFNKQAKPARWIFGNLVAVRCEALLDGQDFFAEPSIAVPIEPKYAFDLDTQEDLKVGEQMLSNKSVVLSHAQDGAPPITVSDYEEYASKEGIHDLLVAAEKKGRLFDNRNSTGTKAFAPQIADLCRLHALIRQNHSFTVLEFGVGYSTIVIADALAKNETDFYALTNKPDVQALNKFLLFSVDTNKTWIKRCEAIIPPDLVKHVDIIHSEAAVGTFDGKICHFYNKLPNIIPDFVYLDGPDPAEVKGAINGMDFALADRTVMAADLLLMEPTLLPGTVILVDGRTNNARFLQQNFQRSFAQEWNVTEDYTLFTLDEPRLGPKNILGSDLFPDTKP